MAVAVCIVVPWYWTFTKGLRDLTLKPASYNVLNLCFSFADLAVLMLSTATGSKSHNFYTYGRNSGLEITCLGYLIMVL